MIKFPLRLLKLPRQNLIYPTLISLEVGSWALILTAHVVPVKPSWQSQRKPPGWSRHSPSFSQTPSVQWLSSVSQCVPEYPLPPQLHE